MSIKKGAISVYDRYRGTDIIWKAYKGSNLIFNAYSEVSGILPLPFQSRAAHNLKDYRIYGTESGAGVQTESGEPAGYKIPILISDKKPEIYGWHVDPSISDPARAITYLGDAVGKTPAAMGASTFSYGDWSNAFFMPKPCMVKNDGTVDYYLDPNDYTKKADGTASDVANLAYEGNAMIEWPLIFWKWEQGETEGEGYFYCSNRKIDDSYDCYCNVNCDDQVVEHFYTAIYNGTIAPKYDSTKTYAVDDLCTQGGSLYKCTTAVETAEAFDSNKWTVVSAVTPLRSVSGLALTANNGNGSTTFAEESTRAMANNTTVKTEWYIDVWADRTLINGLLVLMGKSLNIQAVFGRGLDSGSQTAKEAYTTGSLNDKGLFWGSTSSGSYGVKVFGMENWWACVYHRTAGLIGVSNNNYAYKMTWGRYDGTSATGYNTNAAGYKTVGTRPATNYFNKAKFGQFGFLPIVTSSSSSTTYYSDYYYNGTGFALVGGTANNGAISGAFYVNLNNGAGIANWNFAAALTLKPLANPVTPHTSTYNLYIGDSKLGEDEYLDYEEQKIYKDVSGTLTPTDPPIPFPEISTYQGENTLSSAETVGEVTVGGKIRPLVYGWHVDPTVESPFDAITYLQDAINKTPAAMGSTEFDYGDWEGAWFIPKPCMLNYDCTVAYYLDPNDYSKKLDGTPSDIGDLSFAGNAMVEWPIIWYKFVPDASGEGYSFFCSSEKIDDDYKCWSNINANNQITDHFYTPIYNGIIRDGKLRSMSGFRLTPTLAAIPAYDNTKTYAVGALAKVDSTAYTCITPVSTAEDFDPTKWQEITPNSAGNTTGQTEVNAALTINTTETVEWYTDVWADRVLINALLVLVSKSLGTQSAYGRGLDTGGQTAKEAYVTGSLDDKGLFWGNIAAGTQGVKVFGMENWWALVWRRTAGLIGNGSGGYSFKMTYNTADGSEATAYNSNGAGYIVAKDAADTAIARPANGYVKKMAIAVGGCWLPKEIGGTAAKFYEDYWYAGAGYLLAGGASHYGADCGCWFLHLYAGFGYSYWGISAAPSCKPIKKN